MLDSQKHWYNQHHIECDTTNLNKSEFDNIIKICDIIITQPILDNYREKNIYPQII